jgi:hypothetical protein
LAISMCYSKQHTFVPNSIAGHCASCSRLTQQTMGLFGWLPMPPKPATPGVGQND